MGRTLRTIAVMLLAPPLLLYALAQAGALSHSATLSYVSLVAAWATGMVALLISGWRDAIQFSVGVAYTLAAILLLPLLALLAVCTTGDCL